MRHVTDDVWARVFAERYAHWRANGRDADSAAREASGSADAAVEMMRRPAHLIVMYAPET